MREPYGFNFFSGEGGAKLQHYSLSVLIFRLFMSNFRLLLSLGFNFALSHSLRVKRQVVLFLSLKVLQKYNKEVSHMTIPRPPT